MKIEKFVHWFGPLVIVGIFLVFAFMLQQGSSTQQNPNAYAAAGPQDGRTLVFNDSFDAPALDDKKWSTCYDWRLPAESGCTNGGNFEQEWYTGDQVKIEDGHLVLTAEKKPMDVAVQKQVKTFDYRSGMVNSGRGSTGGSVRWAGTYGYYEARIKFQTGQGVWPAFWLLPTDKEWPPEIDIMEFIGSKPGEILQTLHWAEGDSSQKSEVVVKGLTDYSADWHTYAVDWQPDRVDWYIDGKKTRSYTGSQVPHEPMEIILNLAIGGQLPGNADATTPAHREMRVDYVRVYQSNEQARPHSY